MNWRYLLLVIAWWLACEAPLRAAEPERFALLVGVTDYIQPKEYSVTVLKGPANDVVAMKRLLVGSYKFNDDGHVRVLTGAAASRKGIEQAFKAHLVENARRSPNAIVVFYFSGHGSTTADQNGDEGDGVDETLVAYDSRGPEGRDIVDDEVDAWLSELRRLTPNITVIFDSCHSGSATRGEEVSRSLPPNPNIEQPTMARDLDGDPTPHLLRRKTYVGVSASMADESSYENTIAAAGGKVHGYLTWFLTQTLDRRPYLTWRQAKNEIERGVASVTKIQHPQIDGSLDRTPFGLPSDQGTPFVRLTSQDREGNITVAAGIAQGLVEGGTLAIYAPSAKVLTGDASKIATARIASAGVGSSKAVLIERPKAALPPDAKVTIVTPFYGTAPMLVRLDTLPDQSPSHADAALLERVRAGLAGSAVVKAAGPNEAWVASVQRGCLAVGASLLVESAPEGCTPSYYVAGRQAKYPIISKYVPVSAVDAGDQLARVFTQLARVSALRALTNDNSRLSLTLEMMRAEVKETASGELIPGPVRPIESPTTPLTARIGDWFTFKVTNKSAVDVYAALLILNASGTITVLTEAQNGDLVKAGKTMTFVTPIRAGLPLGIDTYKVIATTKNDIDFSVLESPDEFRRADASPLQRLLASASSTMAKDGEPVRNLKLADWITVQTDVKLLPAAKGTRQ